MPALPIVALFGPTGVGKTEVAIALAERLRAEGEDPVAVSADALQLYARPRDPHRRGHGRGARAARAPPARRPARHRPCDRRRVRPRRPPRDRHAASRRDGARSSSAGPGCTCALRWRSSTCARRPIRPSAPGTPHGLASEGAAALHAELAARDPDAAAAIAPTDSQRVVRALELLDAGATPPGGPQLWTAGTRHPTLLVGLVMDREALRRRVDARVDAMIAAGAVDEVRRAAAAGASPSARQALGFEELLRGDIDAMRTRTRRYAKRQLTWLRKLPGALVLDVTGRDAASTAAEVHAELRRGHDARRCGSRSGRRSGTTTSSSRRRSFRSRSPPKR